MTENILELLTTLIGSDNRQAYAALQDLEAISRKSDQLLAKIPVFAEMVTSKRSFVRVRGFRLLCQQAKWDQEGELDCLLPVALAILADSKPTVLRQALAALHEVVKAKPQLRQLIVQQTAAIDCSKFNQETMAPLIEKDIAELQQLIVALEESR
ncbi:hypothetical protein [Enterococcus diestrammenae]|uniref:hypothetical protein n=1 Tax=Enterococcus diestrammenae TaxID=1155073 RepID=UPI0022E01CBD|nr:hypothetical protein [Enterococcus diestrammenae]